MKKTLLTALKIYQISWAANGWLAFLMIFSGIYQATLYPFVQVFLLAKVLDMIEKNHQLVMMDFTIIVFFYVVATIIKTLLNIYDQKQYLYETNLDIYIDKQIISKLYSLDPATFEKPEFQSLLTQIEGTRSTIVVQLDKFTGFISSIATILTASFVLFPVFPHFVPLVMIASVPTFYYGDVFRKKMWPFFTTRKATLTRITSYVNGILSQAGTSAEASIFRVGDELKKKVAFEQNSYLSSYQKLLEKYMSKLFLGHLLQLVIFFYTQFINFQSVLRGTLGIGLFSLVFQQTRNLAVGTQGLLDMYSSMTMRIQFLEKYFEFIEYQPHIVQSKDFTLLPISPSPPVIEFKNVSFRYPNSKRDIFRNFNLKIKSGEKIAIVGENGAGKTTIIKLLLRFYDVSEGEILLNGINIKNIKLEDWHLRIGALFQDFIKYQFTIKENVYFGDLTKFKQKDEIIKALLMSGASDYLKNMSKGMDQVVGKMFEGGVDLSGGEWQKLALARAFFRNSPILILDEPTSAIDAKAEAEIFEKVQKLQKDKTVIIISHRFSTVRHADRILVVENGHIVEEGNHEKLMSQNGLYFQLFTLQAKGYL